MKKEIYEKLGYLREYVAALKELSKHSKQKMQSDIILRGAVERYLQLSLEIVLEIGEMIIAAEGFKKPAKHREVIETLGNHGILPKAFAERFAPAAGLRNVLVHRYGELDFSIVYDHVKKELGDFDVFAKRIALYLQKKVDK